MKNGVEKASVSVIIPCYCCDETIERAIISIINQTMLPAEIILIDDASPDEGRTMGKLNELKERFSDVTVIKIIALEKNYGPGTARNIGWDQASGKYIAFLDADDSWHPRKIEIQFSWMEAHPEVILSGHLYSLTPGFSATEFSGDFPAWQVKPKVILKSNCFPTPTVMLKRVIIHRFSHKKRYSEDYLLWLQLILDDRFTAWRLELPLTYLHKPPFGKGGLSRNLWLMEKGELNTYRTIYSEGLISSKTFIGLIIFSLAKYIRRLFICILQKQRGSP